MPVEVVCLAAHKADAMVPVESVEVVAGAGIVGDRHFGAQQRHPGQNITLVEAEEIERFNQNNGVAIPLLATRRNLVTRGVRLNDLVGRTFTVGSVTLRGVELCEPCGTLAKYLAGTGLRQADIVQAFAHKCGRRADVLSSGTICRGDAVTQAPGQGQAGQVVAVAPGG